MDDKDHRVETGEDMDNNLELNTAAQQYRSAGLSVLPADRAHKRPAVGGWKQYQKSIATAQELDTLFAQPCDGACVVCGCVSGNLECLDFDSGGEAFRPFQKLVEPELGMRLVCERSPSGGVHVFYRCSGPVDGNQKLALAENGGVLIETRGEGGIVLCAPTEGYELFQGEFAALPLLSPEERALLLDAARSLDRRAALASPPPAAKHPDAVAKVARFSDDSGFDLLPGEDFDARGDIRPLLEAHGWTMVHGGANEGWKRPGKEGEGQSASFNGTVFYVFSSNAAPFEAGKGYGKFGVYAILEHGGDLQAASAALAEKGYGRRTDPTAGVDMADVIKEAEREAAGGEEIEVSEPEERAAPTIRAKANSPSSSSSPTIDSALFQPPGFLGEFVRCGMENAVCPNEPLIFCSGLTALSAMMGQRFRTVWNCWPNIYAVGVARTSTGKGVGQTLTRNLFNQLGIANRLCGKPASGPAVQDSLLVNGICLFVCDEAGDLFRAINAKGDAAAAAASMRSNLLECWSLSASSLARRRLAHAVNPKDNSIPGLRRNPQANLMAFVQPSEFWPYLSMNDLSSGLIPRCIVLEGTSVRHSPDASNCLEPSKELVGLGHRILGMGTGTNPEQVISAVLPEADPRPLVVNATAEAVAFKKELYARQDKMIAEFNGNGDEVAADLCGKATELVEKLALLYAVSENPDNPKLTEEGFRWGWNLWSQSTGVLQDRVHSRIARSDHERNVQRVTEFVKTHDHGTGVTRSELVRGLRDIRPRDLDEATRAAEEGMVIKTIREKADSGKPGPSTTRYAFLGEVRE